jgi:hypothetical protein
MDTTKTFPLGDVLNIATGNLITNVGAIYDVLNYMTGDDLMTHALPRAMETCQPNILAQHPQLADVSLPAKPDGHKWTSESVAEWLKEQEAQYGVELTITPLTKGLHTRINPLVELADMISKP